MDTSATRDSLNDTPTLPELSFDDLLDVSPAKKDSNSSNSSHLDDDDGTMEIDSERKVQSDDTLNTPGPKAKPSANTTTTTTAKPITVALSTATSTAKSGIITTVTAPTSFKLSSNVVTTTGDTAKITPTPILLNSKNVLPNTSKATIQSAPVVLNSKNILPKMTPTLTSQVTKVTPKTTVVAGSNLTSAVAGVTGNQFASLVAGGKTALKTANGQILYIQKAMGGQMPAVRLPAAATATAQKLTTVATSANIVTTATVSGVGGAAANKPVAIQLIRSTDSKALPVKNTTSSVSTAVAGGSKQTTLTLAQNNAGQLAGKKLISTTGGQVVIKTITKPATICGNNSGKTSTMATAATTTAPTSNLTGITAISANNSNLLKNVKIQKITTPLAASTATPKSLASTANTVNPSAKIVVQSANGKQIVVSNQQVFKLSPKSGATPSFAGSGGGGGAGGAGGSTSESSNTIQLIGKSGMQVVRVLPGMKIAPVTSSSSSSSATGATIAVKGTVPVTASTTSTLAIAKQSATTTATTSKFKILNSLPTKFAVLPSNNAVSSVSATKITLTGGNTNTSASSSTIKKEDGVNSNSGDVIVPVTFSSALSKVQKTTVTAASTTAAIKSATSSGSSVANVASITTTTAGGTQLSRKHKIAEINSKIQRVVSSGDGSKSSAAAAADDAKTDVDGPPEAKKLAVGRNSNGSSGVSINSSGGKRILVMQVRNSMTSTSASASASTSTPTPTTTTTVQTRQGQVHRVSVQRAESNKTNTNNNNSNNNNKSVNTSNNNEDSDNGNDAVVKNPMTSTTKVTVSSSGGGSAVSTKSTASTTAISPKKYFSVLKQNSITQSSSNADVKSHKVSQQMPQMAIDEKQQQHSKSLLLKRTYQQQQLIKSSKQISGGSGGGSGGGGVGNTDSTQESQEQKSHVKHSSTTQASSSTTSSVTNKISTGVMQIKDEPIDMKPLLEDGGIVRRKHCNCSKSQCLKLYCDCFANGEFCQDCTCKDCFNNLQYEDERQQAIRNCLERNPSAFKPKITTRDQGDMRLHNKGCNCKRSGCLKNYCECYEAKIPCSSNCKCVGCRNFDFRPDMEIFPMEIKASAQHTPGSSIAGHKRSYDKAIVKNERMKESSKSLNSELFNTASNASSTSGSSSAGHSGIPPEKQQCNLITQEVIDATIQCMISQGDECEKNGLPAYQTEKMVIEECGRCLVEIIDFSIRNTQD